MILQESSWHSLAEAHAERVDALATGHVERRRRGIKHPVEDFLWTYYSLRPGELRRWHPGPGLTLEGASDHAGWRYYRTTAEGTALDTDAFLDHRGGTVTFVRDQLDRTAQRPAQWSCFGLHEWAMVYRTAPNEVRHVGWPLRLGHDGTDAVVEANQLRCTHFDAFRFFTPDAVQRNAWVPTRERQISLEQPGCLHATMDLYKWCYKLLPAVPSGLLMDAFDLARDVRELDMRAAPYDLAELGVRPIRIETPGGKAEYVAEQRRVAERGAALRTRLIEACDELLGGRNGALVVARGALSGSG